MTKVLEQQLSLEGASDNSEDTIALRFERQVAAVPDKLAIVTEGTSLTALPDFHIIYADFNPAAEIAEFWHAASDAASPVRTIISLLILTRDSVR
jgi:hypothetical protein